MRDQSGRELFFLANRQGRVLLRVFEGGDRGWGTGYDYSTENHAGRNVSAERIRQVIADVKTRPDGKSGRLYPVIHSKWLGAGFYSARQLWRANESGHIAIQQQSK